MNEQTHENRIRLVLLDHQALFRASLGRFLASQPGLEVAGECASSTEALEILSTSPADIVLLDFDCIAECGDEFISAARQAGYRGRFLIVAGAADAEDATAAIKLGASGIFLKSEAPDRLVQAIRLVADGAVWLDQRVIQLLAVRLADRFPQPDVRKTANHLTDREQKVILGILAGLSNKKIGQKLGLSEGSIKTSVQQLFYRAGVRTRSQLVRVALEGSLGTLGGLTRPARNAAASTRG